MTKLADYRMMTDCVRGDPWDVQRNSSSLVVPSFGLWLSVLISACRWDCESESVAIDLEEPLSADQPLNIADVLERYAGRPLTTEVFWDQNLSDRSRPSLLAAGVTLTPGKGSAGVVVELEGVHEGSTVRVSSTGACSLEHLGFDTTVTFSFDGTSRAFDVEASASASVSAESPLFLLAPLELDALPNLEIEPSDLDLFWQLRAEISVGESEMVNSLALTLNGTDARGELKVRRTIAQSDRLSPFRVARD